MHFDGSKMRGGLGAGIILTSPTDGSDEGTPSAQGITLPEDREKMALLEREKRAERHGQTEMLHHQRSGDDEQQRCCREDLAPADSRAARAAAPVTGSGADATPGAVEAAPRHDALAAGAARTASAHRVAAPSSRAGILQ